MRAFAVATGLALLGCNAAAGLDELSFDGTSASVGGQAAGGMAAGGMGAGGIAAGGGGANASQIYAAAVLADDPVAYWRLGEAPGSATAANSMGAPDGTYVGGVTRGAEGIFGASGDTAAELDGASGSVEVGDFFDFAGQVACSIEAWVRPTIIEVEIRRIVNKEVADGVDGWDVSVSTDSGLRFDRYAVGTRDQAIVAPPATGSWNHVVATYDGSEMCIYVNANPVCASASLSLTDTNAALFIGSRGGTERHFQGTIDEVAIYDHALSSDQIANHFAAAER